MGGTVPSSVYQLPACEASRVFLVLLLFFAACFMILWLLRINRYDSRSDLGWNPCSCFLSF
jgi:hypothetical protein